jgi:MFS family permease
MLAPLALVTPSQLAAGQRAPVRDLAWAGVTGAFCGGVILVAFALSLGATPLQVGVLAAIPFLAQAAQLPATVLIERLRQRRRIGVTAITAAPLLTVYLIQQRGYAVTTVTALWVTSQLANAATLYLWGRLSDRLSNKAVLAVALPAHFASILALVFADAARDPTVQLALLGAIHLALGVATGGIGLATGNLGLKLAPQGQGTPYLAAIGLVSAIGGGVAPIAAGALAQAFQASELSAIVRWASPYRSDEFAVVSFAHWEFLFALSAAAGLYVMHALSRIDEGREVSERVVVQEFALEALRSLNSLSSVGGALGGLFPFERFGERRRWWARRANGAAGDRDRNEAPPSRGTSAVATHADGPVRRGP